MAAYRLQNGVMGQQKNKKKGERKTDRQTDRQKEKKDGRNSSRVICSSRLHFSLRLHLLSERSLEGLGGGRWAEEAEEAEEENPGPDGSTRNILS